ncbi:hypothetical protein K474DRAFT_1659696 [Panus rudis PR-1116 ss-1]|nr:hypothetical protein K474DRAFT_1659696 [Panus rudis PR-1116 ss-1]
MTTNTLSASTSSQFHIDAFTPSPSQNISTQNVPDVFVIPPEEEQDVNPPFCYFDATEAKVKMSSTSPDVEALDVALHFVQQTDNRAPFFRRPHSNTSQDDLVMPRRSRDILMDLEPDENYQHGRGMRDVDDADVVEVFKVRRNEGMSDVSDGKSSGLKKSRTFRARASQAFKTIKNVGKTKKPAGSDLYSSQSGPENMNIDGSSMHRPSTPTMGRRKSATLSNLFTTTKSRAPTPVFDQPPPSPTAPALSTPLPESPILTPLRPSSSLADRTNTLLPEDDDVSQQDPTMSRRKSFRNRISVLDLHKFFSSSSTSNLQQVTPKPSKDTIRASRRESMPLHHSSSSASSDTQSEDLVFAAPTSRSRPVSLHASSTRDSLASGKTSSSRDLRLEEDVILETSFEMRLDSLHFDSLHFDPDEFDV